MRTILLHVNLQLKDDDTSTLKENKNLLETVIQLGSKELMRSFYGVREVDLPNYTVVLVDEV